MFAGRNQKNILLRGITQDKQNKMFFKGGEGEGLRKGFVGGCNERGRLHINIQEEGPVVRSAYNQLA